MSTAFKSQTQVIIVGGGPVGLGLAIDLGQRDVRCVLIERFKTPQPIPKGQNLTQRTLEHLYFWGVEQELRAARTIPREYGIGGMTAYGTLLSDYKYDWLQRELVRPYYFTDNERLPQYATEVVLRDRISELPSVETVYGWSAEAIEQAADGVTVAIAERDGYQRRTLRADYVVGCDGSRSLVRQATGISQTLSDHDRLMVLLVFRSTGLHKLLERFPNKSFYNVLHPDLKGYWKFFGRVDLGTTWFFHAPVPLGTTKDNFDFRGYLHAAVGKEFDVEFEHIGFWDLRVAIADQYRKGRAFIAGDAAHSHPPYGGYGINTGLEDAANLGWKLAACLQGWAGAGLLDSYGEERQPVFASTARDFIEKAIRADKEFLAKFDPAIDREAFEAEWKVRSTGARSEVNSFEPNYGGSSIVAGAPSGISSAIGSHEFVARAGHHLAPRQLATGRNIFEELGGGFTLLDLGGAEKAVADIARAAKADDVPLKVIRDDRAESRAFYKATCILIRPDQFVAWTSNGNVHDPVEIIRRAIGGHP
ncbi:FAD-dependent monooxygenase [Bradyrhizobium manausense]|uniref:FAD-dependent monooxygenase n=1 Tax=Bradyrhizobium manausense TaxID=989370 RepID=UPI001BA93188|nr:FAD-dependent monooxygenase [Bradyrhizobium manausense]MBR0687781.1 FAD-dependent monooxygenase [Bradyrhizobium manausense]